MFNLRLPVAGFLAAAVTLSSHASILFKGKVVDSQGNPLPGVTVTHALGDLRATTNAQGSFYLFLETEGHIGWMDSRAAGLAQNGGMSQLVSPDRPGTLTLYSANGRLLSRASIPTEARLRELLGAAGAEGELQAAAFFVLETPEGKTLASGRSASWREQFLAGEGDAKKPSFALSKSASSFMIALDTLIYSLPGYPSRRAPLTVSGVREGDTTLLPDLYLFTAGESVPRDSLLELWDKWEASPDIRWHRSGTDGSVSIADPTVRLRGTAFLLPDGGRLEPSYVSLCHDSTNVCGVTFRDLDCLPHPLRTLEIQRHVDGGLTRDTVDLGDYMSFADSIRYSVDSTTGAETFGILNWDPRLPEFASTGLMRLDIGTFGDFFGGTSYTNRPIDGPRRRVIGFEGEVMLYESFPLTDGTFRFPIRESGASVSVRTTYHRQAGDLVLAVQHSHWYDGEKSRIDGDPFQPRALTWESDLESGPHAAGSSLPVFLDVHPDIDSLEMTLMMAGPQGPKPIDRMEFAAPFNMPLSMPIPVYFTAPDSMWLKVSASDRPRCREALISSSFEVTPDAAFIESRMHLEPNDTREQAIPVEWDEEVTSDLISPHPLRYDEDWFSMQVQQNDTLWIELATVDNRYVVLEVYREGQEKYMDYAKISPGFTFPILPKIDGRVYFRLVPGRTHEAIYRFTIHSRRLEGGSGNGK